VEKGPLQAGIASPSGDPQHVPSRNPGRAKRVRERWQHLGGELWCNQDLVRAPAGAHRRGTRNGEPKESAAFDLDRQGSREVVSEPREDNSMRAGVADLLAGTPPREKPTMAIEWQR